MARTLQQRLLEKIRVDPETGCWIWQAATRGNGYGAMWYLGKLYRAHRLAMHAWRGMALEDAARVLHDCKRHGAAEDNRACINPAHLYLGTDSDNMRDRWDQARVTGRSGSLTEDQVRQIRAAKNGDHHGCPVAHFAQLFKVGKSLVRSVRYGQAYTWVK